MGKTFGLVEQPMVVMQNKPTEFKSKPVEAKIEPMIQPVKVMAKPGAITVRTPIVDDVMPVLQPRPRINPINEVVLIPNAVVPTTTVSINEKKDDSMSLFSKIGGLVNKGVTAVKKVTSFAAKATQNPLQAASDLLQGGGASKSGTPKVSTVTTDSSPTRNMAQGTSTAPSGGFMQKAMDFLKIYWMYIIGGFVVLFVIWWFFFKKKKMAARRRRTAPARAARARNRRRTPIRRRK